MARGFRRPSATDIAVAAFVAGTCKSRLTARSVAAKLGLRPKSVGKSLSKLLKLGCLEVYKEKRNGRVYSVVDRSRAKLLLAGAWWREE